jgi:hypothetical protein
MTRVTQKRPATQRLPRADAASPNPARARTSGVEDADVAVGAVVVAVSPRKGPPSPPLPAISTILKVWMIVMTTSTRWSSTDEHREHLHRRVPGTRPATMSTATLFTMMTTTMKTTAN